MDKKDQIKRLKDLITTNGKQYQGSNVFGQWKDEKMQYHQQILGRESRAQCQLDSLSKGSLPKKTGYFMTTCQRGVGGKLKTWFLSQKKLWQEGWCQNH